MKVFWAMYSFNMSFWSCRRARYVECPAARQRDVEAHTTAAGPLIVIDTVTWSMGMS